MPLFLLFDFIILLLIRFFVKIFITIFGWATDIFFGKLPEKNRLWFYLMIVLSFIWIYCLLAKAFPIMFYIFKDYVPENSLTSIFKRILYILCVVAIPPGVGALGAFVTGSGTSTCVLFGGLQSQTAISLGLNPSWMAAANVMGAGIGKMICPQGIAIGAGAIGAVGSESEILRKVFKYFVIYVVIAGIICYAGSMAGF